MGNMLNNLKKHIKNFTLLRGAYFLWRNYFFNYRRRMAYCSNTVVITPPVFIGNPANVFFYDNVSLGARAYISATNAKFIVKCNCCIAENLTVHTGNHARIIGQFCTDISEKKKPKGYDHDVIIESDVWIGCNVTLLSGIIIGRGSTIAAGAVVTKSMPPYSLIGGIPAKVIKLKWTVDEIIEHEKTLYCEDQRYTRQQLEEFRTQYNE